MYAQHTSLHEIPFMMTSKSIHSVKSRSRDCPASSKGLPSDFIKLHGHAKAASAYAQSLVLEYLFGHVADAFALLTLECFCALCVDDLYDGFSACSPMSASKQRPKRF